MVKDELCGRTKEEREQMQSPDIGKDEERVEAVAGYWGWLLVARYYSVGRLLVDYLLFGGAPFVERTRL